MPPKIGVVVPCYNEEAVLGETNRRLVALFDSMQQRGLVSAESRITYVDDGSRDSTWNLIESLAQEDKRVHGIKLSRNRGHQAALLSGLFSDEGDAVISIDADLQDDINVIETMVERFATGDEIVYGVRDSRATDTVFKRTTATSYYKLLAFMGVDLVYNHADYRLLSRRAIESLKQYTEVNLFLRGIVPLLGYRSSVVHYARAERFAGESKYPFRKMLAFAIDGITSFSVVPLRFITFLGILVSVLSFFMILTVLYSTLVLQSVVPGWASSVIPIYFLGGIQLLSIGILGEYIAKIYMESKGRPRYFIEKTV